MNKKFLICLVYIITILFLVSCSAPVEQVERKNEPPVAIAGDDIICSIGETINLGAGKSYDPDGDRLEYAWEYLGKTVSSEELSLIPDKAGTYEIILLVSDGEKTSKDSVRVTVKEKQEEELTDEIIEETWLIKCTRVIDGDTIELENGDRVRYIGINTPEAGDELGDYATEINKELVEGKEVKLIKDVSDTDKYGRILAYVYIGNIFVNAYLVEEGYAQVATYPPDVKYADLFLELQQKAREEGKGFWGDELEVVGEDVAKEEVAEEQQEQEQQEEPQQEEPPVEEPSYGITVTQLTSPISRGSNATIAINTAPNTYCTITVYYKSGASCAKGLDPKNSDGNGNCSWTWKVGTRTTPGDWKIVINVQDLGQIEQYFTVTK